QGHSKDPVQWQPA
ncbi:hypothetical protein D041_4070B, partial [Vibrio parahaemolyticus EKP-008]